MKSDFYTYEDNPIFHLAIPVDNILNAREFYTSVLGCDVGRESSKWVDLNFFGHQLVIHLANDSLRGESEFNEVDGHKVPASHFGIILSWDNFSSLETYLLSNNIKFTLEPYLRFEGQPGEQRTMFIKDPSDNHIEFKSFRNIDMVFATDLDEKIAGN